MLGYIYILVDPREPDHIRYVGHNRTTLKARLRAHITETTTKPNMLKSIWIQSLLSNNIRPIIVLLESVVATEKTELLKLLNTKEVYWISECKRLGHKLENATVGGSAIGHILSEDTKRKISEKHKGKVVPDKVRQKISASMIGEKNHFYGKKHSDETKKLQSSLKAGSNHPGYGKPLSDEHKRKLSACKSGTNNPLYGTKLTEEHKEKIRQSCLKNGRTFIMTEATKEKLRQANLGKKQSPETLEKKRIARNQYLMNKLMSV